MEQNFSEVKIKLEKNDGNHFVQNVDETENSADFNIKEEQPVEFVLVLPHEVNIKKIESTLKA
jgi:hypothetical protein